jgi:hypothetical protein
VRQDLAGLSPNEERLDVLDDRDPDLADVASAAFEITYLRSEDPFVEATIKVALPDVEYAVDDRDELDRAIGLLSGCFRASYARPVVGFTASEYAARRRSYFADHAHRLRVLRLGVA